MTIKTGVGMESGRPGPGGGGKTEMGIPNPGSPRGVVLRDEARKSRHRLYPVSFVYSGSALIVLALAFRSHSASAAFASVFGFISFTLVEYLAHRYVLHGVFPRRGSWWSSFLNKAFDHLHWQHHLRPWDGNHINGTLKDTIWIVTPLAFLASTTPIHIGPAFFAGFMLGYVAEEWCHHSVHFYVFDWPWFRRLKARHHYHHSRVGADILFGLSNGFWDDVIGTGMPEATPAYCRTAKRPKEASLARIVRPLRIRFASCPMSGRHHVPRGTSNTRPEHRA